MLVVESVLGSATDFSKETQGFCLPYWRHAVCVVAMITYDVSGVLGKYLFSCD